MTHSDVSPINLCTTIINIHTHLVKNCNVTSRNFISSHSILDYTKVSKSPKIHIPNKMFIPTPDLHSIDKYVHIETQLIRDFILNRFVLKRLSEYAILMFAIASYGSFSLQNAFICNLPQIHLQHEHICTFRQKCFREEI